MKKPIIGYYDNGQKDYEIYKNNKLEMHREDGPAFITWYINGQIASETYYINGKCHRENGPAEIYYYFDGEIIKEEYWINGKQLDKKIKLKNLKLI